MKKALITGGSRGIGRSIALRLAKEGYEVFINYVKDTCRAAETKKDIEKLGGKCTVVEADLCQADCAEKIFAVTGNVDVLVLNASIQYRNKWDNISISEFETQINCNLRASLLLIQKYAPGMTESCWGRIITIGSVQERKPHPDMLVYSASKSALTTMAQSLALQLAGTGITVNSVAPGVIYTDRNIEALADEAYAKEVKGKIPLGFWGEPDDCAETISYLCSDGARYVTGQNIFVDGGMGIK